MTIALLLHCADHLEESISSKINPCVILKSNNQDKFIACRDLSLELDKKIYLDRIPVDWILFANNDNIRYDNFLSMAPHILPDDDTVFYVEHHLMSLFPNEQQYLYKNFYCRPHVFSLLGNIYKLKPIVNELYVAGHFIDMTPVNGIYPTDEFLRVWLYAINRNNFNLTSIK